jgi:hypothetical protein
MRSSPFWDVKERRFVVIDFSGHLVGTFFWGQVNMGTKDCPEASVPKYQSTLRNILKEEGSRSHTGAMVTVWLSAHLLLLN